MLLVLLESENLRSLSFGNIHTIFNALYQRFFTKNLLATGKATRHNAIG